MQLYLQNILKHGERIAVAVSGGCDSMSLLHFLLENAGEYGVEILAINVEHGIRGESSISDTEFVKDYCAKKGVELLSYSVDAIKHAKQNKLSIEQSARQLRYGCFLDAIKSGKCDKIATAHHRDDNVETVLFNLFRGTGLKGLTGIVKQREDNIIRPFLTVDRLTIEEYAKQNGVPFVTDQTNLSDEYTRNYIRHNITPKIKEIFPELNQSVQRLSEIASQDEDFINSVAKSQTKIREEQVEISLPCHLAVLSRAVIIALKALGVEKDWEKVHIDQANGLKDQANGTKLSFPKGITAIKEYDKIVFFKQKEKSVYQLQFESGEHKFLGKTIEILPISKNKINLKSGFFVDGDKVPKSAVIRTRKDGDIFKKFGGGSKALGDYFTDVKLAQRKRDEQVLLADGDRVLAIFGMAISETVKVDENTKTVLQLKIFDD